MIRPIQSLAVEMNEPNLLKIKTSFCEVTAELDKDGLARIPQLLSELRDHQFGNQTRWLLEGLVDFPFMISAPRHDLLLPTNLRLVQLFSSFADLKTQIEGPFSNGKFQISADTILESSRIGSTDAYDAMTAHSLITEMILERAASVSYQTQYLNIVKDLLVNRESDFFDFMISFLMQTYWVTLNCRQALTPGTAHYVLFGDKVAHFIKEEDGHHHLIAMSLRALGCDTLPMERICQETKTMMNVLKYAMTHSPFAGAAMLPLFEGFHFEEQDPLATLLLNSSRPTAAVGIGRHYQINKTGRHDREGYELAQALSVVSKSEIILAVQLVEANILLLSKVMDSLLKRFILNK